LNTVEDYSEAVFFSNNRSMTVGRLATVASYETDKLIDRSCC